MRWLHLTSLTQEARRALAAGDGKHGKFAVDGNHIAVLDEHGRATDWWLVIGGDGEPIPAQDVGTETNGD